jgi:hypothetical protein
MRPILYCAALLLLLPASAFGQDPALRVEAVQLLEKANGASMSPHLPNLERTDQFRVLDTSSPSREGTFTRVVVQGVGRREEINFGDFHTVDVWTNAGLITTRKSDLMPLEIQELMRIAPMLFQRFDETDVVRTVVDKAGSAGKKLRCVEFDTIQGQKIQNNNEFCFNSLDGTMVSEKLDADLIEYSDYFPFAGALMPGRILFSSNGRQKLDISQTLVELKDSTDNVLAAPPNSVVRTMCKTYRRAIGQSMPQPKVGYGGRDLDIAVRGVIQTDGRVGEVVVDSTERPDLTAEALALVQGWTFSPALCDGNVNTEVATFIVHFRGR